MHQKHLNSLLHMNLPVMFIKFNYAFIQFGMIDDGHNTRDNVNGRGMQILDCARIYIYTNVHI